MRKRTASIVLAMLLLGALFASPGSHAWAQESGTDQESEDTESSESGEEGGEGQSDADAESGAGAGEQEETAEEGPPWTYQMARMTLGLVVLLMLMMGLMYKKLVADRAKQGA